MLVRFGLFARAEEIDPGRGRVDVEDLDGVRALRDRYLFVVHVKEDGFRCKVTAFSKPL